MCQEVRELNSVEDYVDALIQRSKKCIKKNKERLNTAASHSNPNIRTNRKKKKGQQNEIKTSEWILKVTNRRDCTHKDIEMAKKGKHQSINQISK